MPKLNSKPARSSLFLLASAVMFAIGGCSAVDSISAPDIDPRAAATFAMEHYDTNHDGTLEPSELSSCPALAAARAKFDPDEDQRISSDELTDSLTQMFGSPASLTEATCNVTLNGRPLAGATVLLRPIEMLGDTLPPAEGKTDKAGTARLTVSRELIPEEFRHLPLMYPGLYQVEISHPQAKLASRYNTKTELGCIIDPAARGGMSVHFALK